MTGINLSWFMLEVMCDSWKVANTWHSIWSGDETL